MRFPFFKARNKTKTSRIHPHFQAAYQKILSHPLKKEQLYFQTRDFNTDQIFWALETPSVRESSISLTTDLLRTQWDHCPSGETVLKCLRDIPETQIETLCNRVLFQQYSLLPIAMRKELEQSGKIIMDYHKDPYWGDPGKVAVIHGQKEHDSYNHFIYFSIDLISEHYRFTIYIMPRVEGFPTLQFLQPALTYLRTFFPVRLVIFDGEFPTIDVLTYLDQELIPWDARKSQTGAIRFAFYGYKLDPSQFLHPRWHIVTITSADRQKTMDIHVAAYQTNGIMKVITKPIWYACPVEEATKVYCMRFSIDVGYKEKHSFQAKTSSRNWMVRLILFLISVLLWNVWRLAFSWGFLTQGIAISPPNDLFLTRKVIAHDLVEHFVYVRWRL
jgi:hypothetical protein